MHRLCIRISDMSCNWEVHIKWQLQFDFNEKEGSALEIRRKSEQTLQGFNRWTFFARNGVISFGEGPLKLVFGRFDLVSIGKVVGSGKLQTFQKLMRGVHWWDAKLDAIESTHNLTIVMTSHHSATHLLNNQ